MTLAAQPTTDLLDTIATAVEAEWADIVAGLYTNSPAPEASVVYADLTQPTFIGYARVVMTLGARRGNANLDIILPLGMASFQPTTTPTPPVDVLGAFIAKTALTPVLQLFEPLDAAWTPTDTGSALDIIFEGYIKADPNYGGICSTCAN